MAEIKVNQGLCVGCGLCEATAQGFFQLKDGLSTVIRHSATVDENRKVAEAQEQCPTMAISISV